MNNDQISPQGFTRDPTNGPPRRTPLTISTSTKGDGTVGSQSPPAYSSTATPSTAPRTSRTLSTPILSPSTPQYATATRSSTTLDMPKSAGYAESSQRFPRGGQRSGSRSPLPASVNPKRRSDTSMVDKRISDDPKTNVYTQCGRHGDQWLFTGFPFENIKKVWDRDNKE